MSNRELRRAGVIGVGAIGKNHARIYDLLPNTDLAAVHDTDPSKSMHIASQYKTSNTNDLDEFIKKIDFASISVPTEYHYEIAKKLLESDKHVLIEKPITNTPEEAEELVKIAEERNLTLQVGHIERFNPVMVELEKVLDSPKFIEVHRLSPFPGRSTDVGVVLDLMIHDLEIVLHIVKSNIKKFDAVGIPVITKREDIANARLEFENGCVANITSSRISPETLRKIRVFQEDNYLSLNYQSQEAKIYKKDNDRIYYENVQIEKEEPLKIELNSFVECIQNGTTPNVTGSHASKALKLAVDITKEISKNYNKNKKK